MAIVVTIAAASASACQSRIQSDVDVRGANDDIHERILDQALATTNESVAALSIRVTDAPAELKPEPELRGSGAAASDETTPSLQAGSAMPGDNNIDPTDTSSYPRGDRELGKNDKNDTETPGATADPFPNAKAKAKPTSERRNNESVPIDSNPPRSASAEEAAKRDDDGKGTVYESTARPRSSPPPAPSPMAPIAPAETRDPRKH